MYKTKNMQSVMLQYRVMHQLDFTGKSAEVVEKS